jgi:AmmeMemoRadiSam system protein A
VDASQLSAKFAEPKGCFVTLTSGGQLRGCIGNILPQAPLHQAVFENAISSATRDHRFPPVQPAELDKIEIEISVLTAPKPLSFSSPEDLLGKLQAHKDGVVLQMGGQMSTYLPQVWEHFPDKVKFLDSLAEKAGCAPARWREPQTSVLTYRVESFSESDL